MVNVSSMTRFGFIQYSMATGYRSNVEVSRLGSIMLWVKVRFVVVDESQF